MSFVPDSSKSQLITFSTDFPLVHTLISSDSAHRPTDRDCKYLAQSLTFRYCYFWSCSSIFFSLFTCIYVSWIVWKYCRHLQSGYDCSTSNWSIESRCSWKSRIVSSRLHVSFTKRMHGGYIYFEQVLWMGWESQYKTEQTNFPILGHFDTFGLLVSFANGRNINTNQNNSNENNV